jgi:hypothetical protein
LSKVDLPETVLCVKKKTGPQSPGPVIRFYGFKERL